MFALLLPLLGAGCSSNGSADLDAGVVKSTLARDTAPAVGNDDVQKLAADNTTFALDLYGKLGTDKSANLVYSPYSVSIAVAMLSAGATGITQDGIRTALNFTLPEASLHRAFDSVDLALASRAKDPPRGDAKRPFQLNIANSLWGDETLTIEDSFLDTLAVNYGSGVHLVDFFGRSDPSRQAINSWVAGKTNDRIKDLLPQNSIGSDTRFVLVNAIYFDASWTTKFDPSSTAKTTFHRGDGSTTQVDMMHTGYEFRAGYAETDAYQAVELTYSGEKTSMVVVVPKDGAFDTVDGALSGNYVSQLFSSLGEQNVALSFPKFTVRGETISVREQLKSMGMTEAFSDAADFSALTKTESVKVRDVFHKAFIQVDEDGTEAAAATAITGVRSSAILDVKVVNADHPFFYFIRDIPTNTVLFVGRESDPSVEQ